MARQANQQNQETIETISQYEHIRLLTRMYIGRLGDGTDPNDGIYNFIKEIVSNSIHEFRQGYGNNIKIVIKDNVTSICDYGRGIPLKHLADAVGKIAMGGIDSKYHIPQRIPYGLKVINILSSKFTARSVRDGEARTVCFERGIMKDDLWETGIEEGSGTVIQFRADEEIFGKYEYHIELLDSYLRQQVCINRGLEIKLNERRYKSENGLLGLINDILVGQPLYPPIHLRGENIEVVITHCLGLQQRVIHSFANSNYTPRGGIHKRALCRAITKTLSKFYDKEFSTSDCCSLLWGVISIWVEDAWFYDSLKFELATKNMQEGGPTISKYVGEFIDKELIEYLSKHPYIAQIIMKEIMYVKLGTKKSEKYDKGKI